MSKRSSQDLVGLEEVVREVALGRAGFGLSEKRTVSSLAPHP